MPDLTYHPNPCHWLERIRPLGYALLLDSASNLGNDNTKEPDHTRNMRHYAIATAAPEWVNIAQNDTLTIYDPDNKTRTTSTQPVFELLADQLQQIQPVEDRERPFTGGLAGYWGYELNHQLEPQCLDKRQHPHPDMIVGLYLWAIITNHQTQTCELFFHPSLADGKRQQIVAALNRAQTPKESPPFRLDTAFRKMMTPDEYRTAFNRIQQWIHTGDCYQINLAQRLTARYHGDPWQAYKHLRTVSPTPFAAYLDYPKLQVLSLSPERLLLHDNGHIETKPIKGTRPRGLTPAQDQYQAQELLNSTKDRAENLMIVDLLRNDLGRNCKPGTIKVPVLFGLESYANVHHMVSTVTGELAKGHSPLDLLRDAFPGGSITGAPKIRAMQIIRELEPQARSVYCGAIGYISVNGRMDTNITIRTLVADGREIHTWGGGAIVADSECDSEYEESLTKVKNLVNGLESAYLYRNQ